jgi:hypothetical protein
MRIGDKQAKKVKLSKAVSYTCSRTKYYRRKKEAEMNGDIFSLMIYN